MNNSPNNKPSDNTYNRDSIAESDDSAANINSRPAAPRQNPQNLQNQSQVQAPTQAPTQTPNRPTQRPITEEERRRIAAARAAAARMNEQNQNRNNAPPSRQNQRQAPMQTQNPNRNPNPNGQVRRDPNGSNQYRQPNPSRNQMQGQRRPVQPEPLTSRRRTRKVKINAGAVIFVLLIAVVIGVSLWQIMKNPETTGSDLLTSNPQNQSSVANNPTNVSDTVSDTPTGDNDAVTPEPNLTLYDTASVKNSTLDEGNLVLVNYNCPYAKVDSLTLKNAYNERTGRLKVSSTSIGMLPEAFDALENLVAGLAENTGCDDLLIYSGHRTVDDQQRIWDSNMAASGEEYTRTYVAVPGHSEHHTGLACDLGFYTDDGASIPLVDHEFGSWVSAHCTDYGYILRYPAEKAALTGIGYEQWHFRYVGLAHAYAVNALNMCLEEYIDALKLYTADTKMLHIGADRSLEDVNISDLALVSGGWLAYYVPMADGDETQIKIPRGAKFDDYTVSGNNADGFIVTIALD